MFGLFYVFTNLAGMAISETKRAVDNFNCWRQGWDDYDINNKYGEHIYYDVDGKKRDLTSNHIMYTYRKNGDLFIEDTETFKIRNLSEEKRIKEIEKIKRNNPHIKAVFYKHWDYINSELRDGSCGIPGTIYKDVNNGELYFERYITWRKSDFSKSGIFGDFCGAYFYMRISDGMLVSVSDNQLKEDKKNNEQNNYDDFIAYFNSEQKKGGFVIRNRNRYAKGKVDYYLGNENICNN